MEKCFVMLKPGIVQRRLVGSIITRMEQRGFKIIGLKLMCIPDALAKTHYAEHQDKSFYGELTSYITSGPVVALVLQADDCIALVRKFIGGTKPLDAPPGTIRGDFGMHTQTNVMHASDSVANAEREIALFFRPEELIDWHDEIAHWF